MEGFEGEEEEEGEEGFAGIPMPKVNKIAVAAPPPKKRDMWGR